MLTPKLGPDFPGDLRSSAGVVLFALTHISQASLYKSDVQFYFVIDLYRVTLIQCLVLLNLRPDRLASP